MSSIKNFYTAYHYVPQHSSDAGLKHGKIIIVLLTFTIMGNKQINQQDYII